MYKLILLFEPAASPATFQEDWQRFLAMAEKIPGLRRETVSRVEQVIHGKPGSGYTMVHELFFYLKEALETAMQSPEGQAAGRFLQSFTGGRVVLMVAEHLEADSSDFQRKGARPRRRKE